MNAPRFNASFVKRYSSDVAVHGAISQRIDRFGVTALFGPSGCGKTTILRCLAGLERPEQGRIDFAETVWFDASSRRFLPPQRRGVGMLFQDYALFPHMRVLENVAYGLGGASKSRRRQRAAELLERLGLGGMEDRLPHQLSGGQQQRVALARAVATQPRLLLLDEPLSALDASTRSAVRRELRSVLEQLGIPVILVTHDMLEAAALADEVIVLDEGRVLQHGPIDTVFTQPRDRRVAEIVGVESLLAGRVVAINEGVADVEINGVRLHASAGEAQIGPVYACIRAEQVVLKTMRDAQTSARNQFRAAIRAILPEGPLLRVELDAGFPLVALVTQPAREQLNLREGQIVYALVKAAAIHLLPRREHSSS